MSGVLVRRARPGDELRLAIVHVRSWQVGYHGQLPQDLLDGLRPEQRLDRWATEAARQDWPRRGTLVVEDDATVVGFSSLGPDRDPSAPASVGEVRSFYVDPGHWRRGVGAVLMATAVEALGSAGFASAVLWVLESNARAICFYERQGWRSDGAVEDDVVGGTPIRDVRYRRDLDTAVAYLDGG